MNRSAFFKRIFSATLLVWVALVLPGYALAAGKPFPKKVKRILFLGNSITYAGDYVRDIEAYMTAKYPRKHYEMLNLGLPSETVSGLSEDGHADGKFPRPDLHERLTRVLDQIKPDLVFASYGMNDGIYLPLEAGRFDKFKEGILWLHDEVEKRGAKIIHLTPPIHDDPKLGTQGYNLVLDHYSEWLLRMKDSLNWKVIDVHFPMKNYLENKRKTDASFRLAKDGVHPADLGHWLIARDMLVYLGEKEVANKESIKEALAFNPESEKILKLTTERQKLMKEAWLSATGHLRPGIKAGLPLGEAQVRYAEIEAKIRQIVKK